MVCKRHKRPRLKETKMFNSIAAVLMLLVVFTGSTRASVRLTEHEGWTYLSFGGDGVIQNAVKCTSQDEVRKTQCLPDPTQIRLEYTRVLIALILTYVDVINGQQDFHKEFKGLFIGLGTGTAPRFVHHYFPNTELDIVELDPEVVSAVTNYIGLPGNTNVYTQDALLHVKSQVSKKEKLLQRYDVIIHDAFTTYEPAHTLNTVPFYAGLSKLLEGGRTGLAENGLVVANVWCINLNYTRSIAELYAQVFNFVKVLGPLGTEEKNCFVLAHTPSADKVNVKCVDGLCKKSKSKKSKSKTSSLICSDNQEVAKIAKAIQEEAGMDLPLAELIEKTYENRPFSDDTRFC